MKIDRTISLSDVVKALLWVILVVYATGARSQEVKDLMTNNKNLTESVQQLTKSVNDLNVEMARVKTALQYIEKRK